MSDPQDEARLWPASPFDLADAHLCPSCFTVISAPACPACGFALTDPRAAGVLELGRQIVSVELSRQQLMDEIRLAHAPVALREADAPAAASALGLGVGVLLEPVAAGSPTPTGSLAVVDAVGAAPSTTPAPNEVVVTTEPAVPTALTAPEPTAVPPAPPALPVGGATPPRGPGPSTPPTPILSAPRRRLTVPVLLLIVGVSLVGVAAVFFLLLAWFVAGIAVRALIIGGITLATIALASWLRRRDLTATAEGIGALGVVLLALDAWAVRANDLFGAGSGDAAIHAGVSALVIAVLCRLWARVSHLRGPDLAASLALPAGLGFVVGGLTALPPAQAVTAGLLGGAAGGLVHALPAPWSSARRGDQGVVERLVLALSGVGALLAAGITAAFLTGDALPVVVWSSIGIVILGGAHAWLAHRPVDGARLPAASVIAGVGSGAATAAAGLAGWQLALRSDLAVYGALVAPVLAVLVAFVVDVARARRGTRDGLPAAFVSAVVAGLSIIAALLTWGVQAAGVISISWAAWRTDAFTLPVAAPEAPLLAVIAAVVIAGLLVAAPTLTRPVLCDIAPVVATMLLLVAGARTGVPAVLVGTAAALVALTVVVVALLRRRSLRTRDGGDPAPGGEATARGVPVGYLVAGGLASAIAYVGGVATPWLWLVGIVVATAYPIALRIVQRATGVAAVVAVLAPVAIAALSTVLAPGALAAVTGLPGEAGPIVAALLQWVALATLIAAVAVPVEHASRTALAAAGEVLVGFGVFSALTAVSMGRRDVPADSVLTTIGEPGLGIVRGALLLAALAVVAFGVTRISGVPTVLAAALTAPMAAATAYDALRALGVADADGAPLALTAAAVVVPVIAALTVLTRRASDEARPAPVSQWPADLAPELPRPRPTDRVLRRLAADLGAAVTVLAVIWPVTPELACVALGLVAVGFAAASVSRGWVGRAAADPADDRFATTRGGMPLRDAPRRLLAWPAVGAAIAAWWSWLDAGTPVTSFTVESYTAPAAVLLVAFAVLLVRLRRRTEAAVAVAGGLALGLWAPAVEGWTGDALRGVIVALVAAAVCLALSFTPVRGIRPVAPAGAAVALVAVGLVAVERAFEGQGSQVLWLVLVVATAYASGWGAALARPSRTSSRLYGLVAPAAALVAAVVAIVPLADEPRIVAGSIIMLAALHLAAAGVDRLPLTATTRWISLAGAFAIGAAGWFLGAATEIEALSLPVAAMCLVGSVLGMLRRRRSGMPWPAAEGPAWIAGLVLATVPSLLVVAEPARVWACVVLALAAAAGAAAVREPARDAPADAPAPAADSGAPADLVGAYPPPAGSPVRLGDAAAGLPASYEPPAPAPVAAPRAPAFIDVWALRTPTAVLLGLAAVTMALRGIVPPGFPGDSAAAIVAALGAVAVAVLLTGRRAGDAANPGAGVLAAAGTVLLVALPLARPEADLGLTTTTAILGGVLGVAGASVLGLRRWAALGRVLAVGGLAVAVVSCGVRFWHVAPGGGLEPDLWAVAGAGIAAAIALAAVRATPSRAVGRAAGAGFAIATALFAGAELWLLLEQPTGENLRTVAVMSTLTAAAVAGTAARGRLGPALAVVAAIAAAVFGAVALVGVGVRPVELVTVPPALGGLAYGALTLRRKPASRTWPTLGPWLALLTVPSLLHDFAGSEPLAGTGQTWLGGSELWRVVSLGVVAVAMVVIGAVYRLQAPLVLGSAVLLVHGAAQLWPWISTAYVAVPWWLWLGLGGALLIYVAARYEKRMRALRTAFTAVTSLR